MIRIFLTLACAMFVTQSFAHPGHDHNDTWSVVIHLFWCAPLIAGAVALIYLARKRLKTIQNS